MRTNLLDLHPAPESTGGEINVRNLDALVLFAIMFAGGDLNIAHAQVAETEGQAAIAVADSVLAALSSGDNATLARLTLDSAVVGGIGLRDGVERMSLRSWALYTTRKGPSTFTERGFDATARVDDRVAQVWVPYDLYTGDRWSHCGVDTFTMMKVAGHWRVAALIYTIEQPPACRKHPAGPPPSEGALREAVLIAGGAAM